CRCDSVASRPGSKDPRRKSVSTAGRFSPSSATAPRRSPRSRPAASSAEAPVWHDAASRRRVTGELALFLSELDAAFGTDVARLSVERPHPQRIDGLRGLDVDLVGKIAAQDTQEPAIVGAVKGD